jgi:hypothetical protein
MDASTPLAAGPLAPGALTEEQQQIVAHDHGPALVFAVAGAGKTTAMVHRIERLVRERVFAPKTILATSFSRAAVKDIQKALGVGPTAAALKSRRSILSATASSPSLANAVISLQCACWRTNPRTPAHLF